MTDAELLTLSPTEPLGCQAGIPDVSPALVRRSTRKPSRLISQA